MMGGANGRLTADASASARADSTPGAREGRPDGARGQGPDSPAREERPDDVRSPGSATPSDEGRPGTAAPAGSEPPADERRSDPWASGATAGENRGAWATGAAAAAGTASRAEGAAGPAAEHRPSDTREPTSDTREPEPTADPGGAAGSADRPGLASDAEGKPVESRSEQAVSSEPSTRDEQTTRATFGGSAARSGHDLFEPAAGEATSVMGAQQSSGQQAGAAHPTDAEPPEESVDPVVARVAASVEDQVLVVDEQPRYHLMGCRALAAQQTIPLPAHEAVELGFTPCGWCRPAAGLAARHPASARP